VYLKYSNVCVCVNEHFFPRYGSYRAQTRTHTQTLSNTALVRYGPTMNTSSRQSAVGTRINISIVHAQCSLSGNQLLPMATTNGVAPPHDVTLLSRRTRAVDLIFTIITITTVIIIVTQSLGHKNKYVYHIIILNLKTFSITRGMVLGNVFVIERERQRWLI